MNILSIPSNHSKDIINKETQTILPLKDIQNVDFVENRSIRPMNCMLIVEKSMNNVFCARELVLNISTFKIILVW
jgi:hypothetical protein